MNLVYTPQALTDLENIYNYLYERNPAAAFDVLFGIYAGVQFVTNYPEASLATDDQQVRVKLVRRYQYKIFYRIEKESIQILHVRHTARKPWKRA